MLVEDVPGVGKTTLAKALAHSIRGRVPLRPVHAGSAAHRHPGHVHLPA